jgi:hypothetical protein
MEYFETSAKNNINIQEVMTHIMDKVYDNLYAGTGSLGEEVDQGKQSLVLKREKTSNTNNNAGNAGGSGSDCKCSK